jgi:hypothetical protein
MIQTSVAELIQVAINLRLDTDFLGFASQVVLQPSALWSLIKLHPVFRGRIAATQ